ncbi:MAG: flagellin [Gammaproteobacteria bacterium]|nr:flagellin [Gammaproteobacteria bacterium]
MPQIINTNVMSLNSQRNLNKSQGGLSTALQRLSSGLRINSAKDDAAGLAISERFTSQIRGLTVASRNANDGISLSQVAEGALTEVGNILQRVRELSVQSANATNSASDRSALQLEVGQLTSELNRIAKATEFNGQKLLDGSFGTALFQVGSNADETIVATTANFKTQQYGDYRVSGNGNTVAAGETYAAGSISISGSSGTQTVSFASTDSAETIAAAVNLVVDDTGVRASAKTTADVTFGDSGTYRFNLSSENATAVEISFNITEATGTDALSAAVNAFNDQQAKTGVVATISADSKNITLTNYDGKVINLQDTSFANSADVSVTTNAPTGADETITLTADTTVETARVQGQVTFDSDKAFVVSGTATDVVSGAAETSELQKVADLDISTVSGANLALSVVDAAISQVSNQRAKFGALQNRFSSTISNLETSVENLSAARSRIRDADFAVETAELTRTQILQQAGTAMLAQANSIPQNVLSLLG